MPEIPTHLFRYFSINDQTNFKWIESIFSERKLFFPTADMFNDPFDCNVDLVRFSRDKEKWKQYMEGMAKRKHPDWNRSTRRSWVTKQINNRIYDKINFNTIRENLKKRFYQNGILCLTEVPDNLLMWSHYANGHRGFCLCFEHNNPFFGESVQVEYIEEYPEITGPSYPEEEEIRATVFSKSKIWEYEKEWRLVKIGGGKQDHVYPEGALKAVFFGCQMENTHKHMIFKWANSMSIVPEVLEYRREKRIFGLKPYQWKLT
ncbi:DUF2971 domain-containing protein [Desulfoferula mesophila]|uniref:DUF2971 domain-containing protein n=1 Tax=Desulfoferula mesophila TaxID=3058419 RepID=A0AAU9EIX4_9BACT|nr:hypothetical protein FAK_41390 [Desulfoferula mesophilus]